MLARNQPSSSSVSSPRPPYKSPTDLSPRPPYKSPTDLSPRPPYKSPTDLSPRPPYKSPTDLSPRPPYKTPECAYCREVITDVVVQAMDTTWHQEHFLCAHCQTPISSHKYHVYDGKSYCEADYSKLFLKKCSACLKPIKDVVVMALNRSWHKDHFVCDGCSTILSHKGFYERNDKPYCTGCFESKFCPLCRSCDKPILDQAVIALGDKYHVTCFRCARCDQAIRNGTFKVIEGNHVCDRCYRG